VLEISGTWIYELTDWGRDLEPIVIALGRWDRRLPAKPGAAHVIDSLILALKWRFDPDPAGRLEASCELRLADDRFRVEVGDGQIEVQRGEADEHGDPAATGMSASWVIRPVFARHRL
jgi:hypothetical protein